MNDPAEKLQKWIVQELNIVSDGRLQKIPNTESLRCLMKGKTKRIWTYVFDHVHSEAKVHEIKRSLLLKRKLEDDETDTPFLLRERVDALREAVAKAREKQIHLKNCISNKHRIMGIEHETQNIKKDVVKYSQKSAFLNVLQHKYKEKNKSLRIIFSNITALANRNKVFRKTNLISNCNGATYEIPELESDEIFGMLYDCSIGNNLSHIISGNDSNEIFLQNFYNAIVENVVFLPDLIITLKKVCNNSLDSAINLSLQNVLSNSEEKKVHNKDDLIKQLQYDYIMNRLQIKKNSKIISCVNEEKEKIEHCLSNKLSNSQYAHALPLLQILAENNSYVKGNVFLEECLKKEKSQLSEILKKNSAKKQKISELQCLQNEYFKLYDVIVWLIIASEETVPYILCESEGLRNFTHQDIFTKVHTLRKFIVELKHLFEQDRIMMWKYCDKKNIIKTNMLAKAEISTSSNDLQESFGILPFQNIDRVYEKFYQLKVKVNENNIEENMFIDVYCPDNLKKFIVFLEDLKKMKQTLNEASSCVDNSLSMLDNFGNLLTDWWDQGAQFIPDLKYDGQPLKMWLDVLSVLHDF